MKEYDAVIPHSLCGDTGINSLLYNAHLFYKVTLKVAHIVHLFSRWKAFSTQKYETRFNLDLRRRRSAL